MTAVIKPFSVDQVEALQGHLGRHRAESGQQGFHFMPFAPKDLDGPRFITLEKAVLPLDTPGWQRWFCAWDAQSNTIVGHVDLKQDGLRTALHRCELGIGIEAAWRGKGIGMMLMQTAIAFVGKSESLAWLDLRHFAHNRRARALYDKLGFVEVGRQQDRFRIGDDTIDDVLMTLRIR